MNSISITIAILALGLEAGLLLRAWKKDLLSKFPLFYSYVAYVLAWSLITLPIYFLRPQIYASYYWFFYLTMMLAEFAVIAEASDQIFSAYPMIRRLGRLLTGLICVILFAVYVIPPLTVPQSSFTALLELDKRLAMTKAALIFILLMVARLNKLRLGKNVYGMMLGFLIFVTIGMVNIQLVQTYGANLYFKAYTLVQPVAFVLALSIWTVALWRYELASVGFSQDGRPFPDTLSERLGRYNSELSRLFRR